MIDIPMPLKLALALSFLLGNVATAAAQGKDEWGDALPRGALMRLGTSRFRHAGQIYSMAYSADGRYLVTANVVWPDSSVVLWDAQTGREVRRWQGQARGVAISPDNKRIAVAGYGKLAVYDVDTGTKSEQINSASPECASFSNNGQVLFVADRNLVRRWDLNTGKELEALRGHADSVFNIAIAAKGTLIAASSFDGIVRLYEGQATGALVHRHTFTTRSRTGQRVTFSADGKQLLCGSFDNTLHLWNTATYREIWRVKTNVVHVSTQAFSPDGKTLAAGGQDAIEIRDAATGNTIRAIKVRHQSITHVHFSPDGKRIATAGDHAAVQFWDPATGKEISQGEGHQHAVTAGGFAPDGKTLATVSNESFIRLWDLRTGKVRRFAEADHRVHSIAFAPNGKHLVTSSLRSWPALWDLATGREVSRFTLKENDRDTPGGAVAFSADGQTLASSAGSLRIRLWNTASRLEQPSGFQGKFSSYDSPMSPGPECLQFVLAPDGKSFATTSMLRGRGSVILWDIAANKERLKLAERGEPIAFTPDSGNVAILDKQQVILVDTATGLEFRQFEGDSVLATSAAFSPDGKSLATAGDSSSVKVWEVVTGKQRRVFAGHRGGVRFVTFSPDGRQLASGSEDLTALLWDLTGAAKRALTPDECEALWTSLGSADAEKAYDAIWTLAASSAQTVPFLQARLKPTVSPDPKLLARLIVELDSERFIVRQHATQELAALGELAAPALRAIPQGQRTLEFRRRVEELLHRERTAPPPPEQLRQLRAVEVLEHARTVEARRILEAIAKGASEARLTQDAKSAAQRLSHLEMR